MSRHRNVRGINYNQEYDDVYNSAYPQSMEDDYCVSPGTMAQFTFNHDSNRMSSYIRECRSRNDTVTEDDIDEVEAQVDNLELCPTLSELSDIERTQLTSCVEELQNVVGETVPESLLLEKALKHRFSVEKALDEVLNPKKFNEDSKTNKEEVNKVEEPSKDQEMRSVTPVISKETPKSSSQNEPVQININSSFSQRLDNKSTLSPLRDKRDSSVDKRPRKKSPAPPDRNAGPQVIGITKQVKTVSRDAMLEEFKKIRSQTKPLINLVVIGHVDAGKSTLMGRLLYDLGCVTKKSMHRYETDSKKIGKESFLYAWILDETDEERTRGITMDIGLFRFETPSKSVNILDAPGHRDFIPNMITGASHADVAILIVDATRGEFEAGFDSGGQTREHALLVRSLGVTQLIVVINKLDNVKWSQERYNEVKNKLAPFLAKQCGFKEQDITYVPCSGFHGQNVASRSAIPELTSWYQGPCLLEVIDSLSEPERAVAKSFRLNISDVFKGPVSGVCVSGQIDSGTVQIGQRLIVMPNSEQAVVKAISLDEANVQQAFAGDQVALTLSGCDAANIAIGNIVCDLNDPSPVSTRFESRILLFNLPVPLTKGFPLVLHCKNLQEQVVIKTILAQLNKSTGKVVKNKPRCLTSNTSALVELEASRPISLELYQDYKDLGRITLRSNGVTVAAGLVTKVF
ncbi:translation elongation factor EF-1alpha (GTPase) HBS1 isoform X3 [Brevipalpus obovatus]|uniref:translation elongation factor EF-1alpha (GTPase) HBS1 isoform X3 n=1 Tax=Brevipalpus obovatus TaxID=246614 RepID=UPI003D9E8F28